MTRRSRRWLWLLIIVPIGFGLARLHFDVEVLNLLPGNSSVVQGLKLYQQNFANARELVITIAAPDAEKAEEAARGVASALRKRTDLVAEAVWQPPWLEHPGQAAELIAYLWMNLPAPQLASLTNRINPTNLSNTLAEAREQLATSLSPNDLALSGYDPFGFTRLPEGIGTGATPGNSGQEFFASPDGRFRVIFVEAARGLITYPECEQWLKSVQEVVEMQRREPGFPPDVTVNYTGRPAFVAEIGGGMERDIAGPSLGTLAVIALLFYLTHRCWRPLFWLVALLLLSLVVTLALGGLIYGTLNVVSLGFASILIGLGEDFGIVLFQESRSHPTLSAGEIRRQASPGIIWSAITTSGAFLLLNLSGMPGLGQLGTLVALGVAVAAIVMLVTYLPPLMRGRNVDTEESPAGANNPGAHGGEKESDTTRAFSRAAWIVTGVIALTGVFLLWIKPPRFDQSPDALRPRNSSAYAALNEIKVQMNRPREPLWVIVNGRNELEVSRGLAFVQPALERAASNQVIAGFTLPGSLWPQPEFQSVNRRTLIELVGRRAVLRHAALAAGFTSNSLALTESILDVWQQAADGTNVFWPTNDNSRWILDRLTARGRDQFLAIGLIHPPPGNINQAFYGLSQLGAQLARSGVCLSGWELLGPSVATEVKAELLRVLVPILALVLVTLWLAFRNFTDVLLSLATLLCSGLMLHGIMVLGGWSWNMMNLMALPLLLGMGVDFGIHMQLALRRQHGDLRFVRRSVGRALLLAGSTTVAGFASLSFASNAGIAALGRVCAAGIVCAMLAAVYLLPAWWLRFCGTPTQAASASSNSVV